MELKTTGTSNNFTNNYKNRKPVELKTGGTSNVFARK